MPGWHNNRRVGVVVVAEILRGREMRSCMRPRFCSVNVMPRRDEMTTEKMMVL